MNKGLEKLKTIRHIHDMECGKDESINKDFDIIEKELKALEIIKDKKVNVPNLIALFKSQTSYEEYEQLWDNDIRWQLTKNWDIQFSRRKLTQEDWDLLKEVLL